MKLTRGTVLLKRIFGEENGRKPFFPLLYDLIWWFYHNKGGVYFFYIYRLHLKGKNVKEYLTNPEYEKIHEKLDPTYYRPLLEDKIIFDRYIKSFHIPSPEMLGIIDNGYILWMDNSEYQPVASIAGRPMQAYCKLVTSFGGKNIFKLDVDENRLLINNEPATIEYLVSLLGKQKYILQKTIIQHDKLNEMNPSCVNTIRVYTISNGEHPVFYGSILRMGVDNNIVDNVSSNNLGVGIKPDHYLFEEAHTGTNPPEFFRSHPNSKIRFEEFQIPFLDEAYRMCCEAHKFFGDFFFIAWDIAITPTGPEILEGNPAADLFGLQILHGGQKEKFTRFANEYSKVKMIA